MIGGELKEHTSINETVLGIAAAVVAAACVVVIVVVATRALSVALLLVSSLENLLALLNILLPVRHD